MSESANDPIVRQQEDRIAGRKASLVVLFAILITLGGIFAAGILLRNWIGPFRGGPPSRAFGRRMGPPEIGIVDQTPIDTDRFGQRLRATQRRTLEHYAWIDREHGVARIPIERAMDIVVQRGVGTLGANRETPMPTMIDVRIPAPGVRGGPP